MLKLNLMTIVKQIQFIKLQNDVRTSTLIFITKYSTKMYLIFMYCRSWQAIGVHVQNFKFQVPADLSFSFVRFR